MNTELVTFYKDAKQFVLAKGYKDEIDWQNNVDIRTIEPIDFFGEYCWVVLSAGMKNQIARQIMEKVWKSIPNFDVVGHLGKRKALYKMWKEFPVHFDRIKAMTSPADIIEYLDTLPWIGPITKWHLAKNIGIDVAKPDRHLVRLAERFGYQDVQRMCLDISTATHDKVSVIDLILWRHSNLVGTR